MAPKIEISTRTVIEEVGISELDIAGAHIVNPKLINSKVMTMITKKYKLSAIIVFFFFRVDHVYIVNVPQKVLSDKKKSVTAKED